MKTSILIALFMIINMSIIADSSLSEKVKDLKKTVIYKNDFNSDNFNKETEFKGSWRALEKRTANGNKIAVENNVLVISHPREIKHPLGVFWDLKKGNFLTDVAVQAKFKIKSDEEMTLGFTGDNKTKGHSRIFMLTVNKDGCKFSDVSSKGSHTTQQIKAPIASDKWHKILFLIQGDKCTVYINDLPAAVLESKGLANNKKTFKLGTKTGFEIDDLTLWSLAGEAGVVKK